MLSKLYSGIIVLLVFVMGLNNPTYAQVNQEEFNELKQKVASLESENSLLKNQLNNNSYNLEKKDYAPMGLVLFLFGCFCALWAQNTGRNPWIWFFLGLAFSVLTVVVLLINNSRDQNS